MLYFATGYCLVIESYFTLAFRSGLYRAAVGMAAVLRRVGSRTVLNVPASSAVSVYFFAASFDADPADDPSQ